MRAASLRRFTFNQCFDRFRHLVSLACKTHFTRAHWGDYDYGFHVSSRGGGISSGIPHWLHVPYHVEMFASELVDTSAIEQQRQQ
eukprot:s1687_g14.t1